MHATFVQVEPALLEDPDRVESLFVPELPGAFEPERMREAILSRGPQLLAGAIDLHPNSAARSRPASGRRRTLSGADWAARRSSR